MRIFASAPGRRATPPRFEAAVAIRKLFEGRPLVPGVKTLLAHIRNDPALARVRPPLAPVSHADREAITSGHDAIRAKKAA